MEYQIVSNQSAPLVAQVTKLIAEGWEPLGGVAVNSGAMYQAMIRRR